MTKDEPFLLLAADTFPPLRTSGAIQLFDLAKALSSKVELLVITASPDIPERISLERVEGFWVLRVKTRPTKDVNYLKRVLNEFLMPFAMWRSLKETIFADRRCAGCVWYSPTIFLGPLIHQVKKHFKCRAYIVLRDLFPDWAVDAGVMRKGLAYRFLKRIESYQYRQADVIGVQTPANLPHLAPWDDGSRRMEVLPNWLAPAMVLPCSLQVSDTPLAGRKILVYAGNMGVAQDMGPVLDLAAALRDRTDWGFLFVGRGSEVPAIKRRIVEEGLDNVALYDEIQPEEIPGLFAQCHIGIVALDPRHTTHNIPGKFIAYMRSGLPVLARVNRGNDLQGLVNDSGVGVAVDVPSPQAFIQAAERLLSWSERDFSAARTKALSLWSSDYSAQACAMQILAGLNQADTESR